MDNEKIRAKRDELVQQREQLMKQHEALSRQLEQTEQRIIAHNGAIEALDELLKQAESEAAES